MSLAMAQASVMLVAVPDLGVFRLIFVCGGWRDRVNKHLQRLRTWTLRGTYVQADLPVAALYALASIVSTA